MATRGFEVLEWAHRFLPSPADRSLPLVLSDEQAEFVCAWYEMDAGGEYVWRRGAIEASKGWGKSPLGAVIALAEFAGPVAPAVPWVQLAACSEEQAFANTYSVVWALLSENDERAAHELGINLGRGRLYLHANPGAKLEAVAASWGAREGQRVTFALLDETQHFLKRNGGHALARTLRRNAAKMDGRTLELANAPELGEESIAEQTQAEAETGAPGILFHAVRPSLEPTPEMSDEQLLELLREVYAGSPWIDVGRILREVRDPGQPWAETLRFYFNVPSAGMLAAVDPLVWAEQRRPRDLVPGERIGLGFDGSSSRDATALVGCTADGLLWPIAILERPAAAAPDWRIPRPELDEALVQTFERYDVGYLCADPWRWQAELDEWAERWPGRVVAWHTNMARFADPVDRLRTGLQEGRIWHAGEETLTRHVLNARLRKIGRDDDGRGRYRLEKAGPGRLIDGAVAAALAVEAAAQMGEAAEVDVMVRWS